MTSTGRPCAIDPPGCGCTECLTGEYVPLDRATNGQLRRLVRGEVADHTGLSWEASRYVEFSVPGLMSRKWKDDTSSS